VNAIIFDTETTGLDEPAIVEAAWLQLVSLVPLEWSNGQVERFNPGKPISLGALATHHIADEDLVDCRPANAFVLPQGTQYVIGHNVDYDMKAIGDPPVKRICTLALCRKLWPEADSHAQTAMFYLLERDRARDEARNAHSAGHDVTFCAVILRHVLKRLGNPTEIVDLWAASELARVPDVMPFGKHKGMRISDVPPDYKRWLLGQPDVDPYLRQALTGRAAA
jgi:exodeoxyribonuclease X